MTRGHRFHDVLRRSRLALLILTSTLPSHAADEIRVWSTSSDLRDRMTEKPGITWVESAASTTPARGASLVVVDANRAYQTLLGLGASLESTTCSNLFRIPEAERERVMDLLVNPRTGIGMNLMRVCMGTSDFTGDPWYSYDDLPAGGTDPGLEHFSIEKDRSHVLPMLQLARKRNADLLFFASPWSPPGWMKSNGTLIGGTLLPQWYSAYAQYFVRFIQAYEAEGIPIHAVTVQNEPGVDRAKEKNKKWHYPSCGWTGEQERDFIRDHLGPALRKAGLKTRIWCYDHNYNLEPKGDDPGLAYPRAILRDPAAAAFVDGVAFHGYEGKPEGMSTFHREFPEHPVHFTEGSVFAIWGARDLIDRLRNDAVSYNAWVMILDEKGRPNNGPFPATRAILRLHSDTLQMEELFEYYCYGQFMKFLPRGAVRVESTPGSGEFHNVAFRTPDGALVLVTANTADAAQRFTVREGPRAFSAELGPKSVATFRWPSPGVRSK